jgi:hypothetical protein
LGARIVDLQNLAPLTADERDRLERAFRITAHEEVSRH